MHGRAASSAWKLSRGAQDLAVFGYCSLTGESVLGQALSTSGKLSTRSQRQLIRLPIHRAACTLDLSLLHSSLGTPNYQTLFLSTRIANASEFERGTRRERATLDEWIGRNPSTKVSSSSSCCPLTNHPASAASEGSCQCSFLDPTLSRCGRVFRDPKPVWALCKSSRLGVPEPNGQHGGPGCVGMPGPTVFFIDVYGVHETSYRARHARTVPSSHRQSNQSSSSMPCLPKELDFGGRRKGAPLRR